MSDIAGDSPCTVIITPRHNFNDFNIIFSRILMVFIFTCSIKKETQGNAKSKEGFRNLVRVLSVSIFSDQRDYSILQLI